MCNDYHDICLHVDMLLIKSLQPQTHLTAAVAGHYVLCIQNCAAMSLCLHSLSGVAGMSKPFKDGVISEQRCVDVSTLRQTQ